jgi:NADH:ubiquinone oxidoreductase subunit 6 (subunit J)
MNYNLVIEIVLTSLAVLGTVMTFASRNVRHAILYLLVVNVILCLIFYTLNFVFLATLQFLLTVGIIGLFLIMGLMFSGSEGVLRRQLKFSLSRWGKIFSTIVLILSFAVSLAILFFKEWDFVAIGKNATPEDPLGIKYFRENILNLELIGFYLLILVVGIIFLIKRVAQKEQ